MRVVFHKICCIGVCLTLCTVLGAPAAIAQNASGNPSAPTADSVIQRIYSEGMHHSHAELLAQVLMDSIGPRLTGSPANRAANDWLVRTYTAWGIPAHNEQYGTWRSWTRGLTHIDLLAPRVRALEATALGWSPGTPPGGVTGEVLALPPTSETRDNAGFAHWLRTVRGKFVLLSPPPVSCLPDTTWATYALPAAYHAMQAARDSMSSEWEHRAGMAGDGARPLRTQLEGAGVAGFLTSSWKQLWGVEEIMSTGATIAPVIDVSCEDYSLLARLAMRNQHPRIHAVAEMHMAPKEAPVYNTIAELKGTAHPDQYVMLSAHLDSWDSGSGATDNGVGTIVMLEAMRLLKLAYPHPKRTILVGHWSGEEQGEFGSNAFAAAHPEIVRGLQALFNQDDGGGRTDHILTSGFLEAHAAFDRWMSPLPLSLVAGITVTNPGNVQIDGSDEDAFTCRGAPGFLLNEVGWDGAYAYHSNKDTFDKLSFDDVERNATLIALLAYEASEDPQQLSRDRRKGRSGATSAPCFPTAPSWAASRKH